MKIYRVIIIAICCFVFSKNSNAEKVFDFTTVCKQAYDNVMSLKLNQGKDLIAQARKENPNNLAPDFIEEYIDFFTLYFDEDPAEYKGRKANFDKRLELFSEGPSNSPYKKYCSGVTALHKAIIAIKFNEQWTAAWAFKKANALIKENKQQFPTFEPNEMFYGSLEVMIGVIPNGYKWLAGIFGLKGGGIKSGMQRMRSYLNSKDSTAKLFTAEANFYYCYLMFYIENKPNEALDYITKEKLDIVNNHLYAYLATSLAISSKRTEYAKSVIQNRNTSSQYLAMPFWDYEMAYVKMHKMEFAEAVKCFDKFLQNFKGRFNIKDSYQKLSWCYYLQGNYSAAEKARQQILIKGTNEAEADKSALKEAKNGLWPNALLLKARLYNDGGYNKEALAQLQGKSANDFEKIEDKLDFSYRLARIYDDLDRDKEAINAYLYVIKIGEKRTEYYAARSAVQIGMIYEKQGNKALAIAYYQKCLDMGEHEYKDSLDQKAKAGIGRCKGA